VLAPAAAGDKAGRAANRRISETNIFIENLQQRLASLHNHIMLTRFDKIPSALYL
jgi:hypothetical protein